MITASKPRLKQANENFLPRLFFWLLLLLLLVVDEVLALEFQEFVIVRELYGRIVQDITQPLVDPFSVHKSWLP